MAEQHPTPPESQEQSFQEKINKLKKEKCIDISDGFPAQDKDELWAIYWHFFQEGLTRLPIIGILDPDDPDNGKIKTFIMFDEPGGTAQHLTLWGQIEQLYPDKKLICAYTTAIDGFSTTPAPLSIILEDVPVADINKRATFYLSLQPGSIFVKANRIFSEHAHPVNKDFTDEGKHALKDIFEQIGVKTNY